jgi:hypothetical protein
MPVPPADTEGPTEEEIMDETIFGEENSEYRRWIRRLYELGFPEFLVNGKRLKLRRENQRCDHHPAKKRGTY